MNGLRIQKDYKQNCQHAADEQKNRRGRLKIDIIAACNDSSESRSSKDSKDTKLKNLCNRAKELCIKITERLYDDTRQERWKKTLTDNPATAIFMLAQLNNILFKERSGNARTCSICSVDNALRMHMIAKNDKNNSNTRMTANAQRLPAIATRVIDGAIKRVARIVGAQIAHEKWTTIEANLKNGKAVCVPIITESNSF